MAYYINSAASSDALTRDLKELVPAPEVRRRMSRVLRMGVATGMEALAGLPPGVEVGAIITATRMGCLADSEKFLRAVVENDGGLLNPTPFIQSTFNTAGAQIALLTGNHCYNMTYVHGEKSMEAALVDAMIRIDQAGAEHVLVGLFDETTPTLERICGRMRGVSDGMTGSDERMRGVSDGIPSVRELPAKVEEKMRDGDDRLPWRDGAWFFVVSARPLPGCLVQVEVLDVKNLERWLGR